MLRNSKASQTKISLTTIAIVSIGSVSTSLYVFNFDLGRLVARTFPHWTRISTTHLFLVEFLVLYALYLSAIYLIFKMPEQVGHSRILLLVVLLFGFLFRLSLVGTTPVLSSDIYRYIWDGRVQMQGINPYLHPPSSDSLASFRDKEIYPHINRPSFLTVYPAGAQLFFHLCHRLTKGSLYGFKLTLVFFDGFTMLFIIALLKRYRHPVNRYIIYAWNPLVIFEIAHSGHLEGFTVFLIVLAFLLHATNREILAVLSLAAASATKLYPGLLLPAFVNKGVRIKKVLIFFSCLAVFYLPYWSAGKKIAGFLPIYFKSPYESFNLGLKYFLMRTFHGLDHLLLTKVFVGIILTFGLFVFFKDKDGEGVLKYAFLLISLLLIFMPAALHPWYVIWIIPLLTFYPAGAWLFFSGAVAFSYLKYASPQGGMPLWVLCVEYIPLFVLLLIDYLLLLQHSKNWFPWKTGRSPS